MVWDMIQFLFPALLVILLWCLYGRNGKRIARFYWMMAGSETVRKFYVQLLVVFLLVFHLVYVSGYPGEYGVLPSTVLFVLLCPFKRADRWLHRIYEDHRTFAPVALAAGIIPHLYTMAVTVGFLLLTALFYSSCTALGGWKDEKTREHWRKHLEVLAGHYY